METPTYTPVEQRGNMWLKRDDMYEFAGIRGGKVRACRYLASMRHPETGNPPKGLVTASARKSPQMQIVARVAAALGIPARCHTACGPETPEMEDAVRHGAQLIRHHPGYNPILCRKAEEDCRELGWQYIPFGMEHEAARQCTTLQVAGLVPLFTGQNDRPRRIVITIGSGMSAAGVLHGIRTYLPYDIPVLGIQVGADPTSRLNRYAPVMWRRFMRVIDVTGEIPYASSVNATVQGVVLDPHYEAKAVPYLADGDLFWIIGVRAGMAE